MATGFSSAMTTRSSSWLAGKPSSASLNSSTPAELPIRSTETKQIPAAEVRHLKKLYGTHLAVKDVSFSIQRGEVLGEARGLLDGPGGDQGHVGLGEVAAARVEAPSG